MSPAPPFAQSRLPDDGHVPAAVHLALVDVGLPGGRCGLALLLELGDSADAILATCALDAAGSLDRVGAALDMGGLKPPRNAHPATA